VSALGGTGLPTRREILKLSHPFFERLRDLKSFFDQFEEIEHQHGGTAQDWERELLLRGLKGTAGEDEAQALTEYQYNSVVIQTMHRQCQIIMLYSAFELMCKGILVDRRRARTKLRQPRREKKLARKEDFVVRVLEAAERGGMQSSVWPDKRNAIEVFVRVRHHLVHEGLEVTYRFLNDVKPYIHSVDEFPGGSGKDKIDWLQTS
jgi:hypothetical protein